MSNKGPNKKETVYHIEGMHCASCEILIEKKLLDLSEVKSVEASLNKGKVVVGYEGEKPELSRLNGLLRENGYTLSESKTNSSGFSFNDFATILGTVLIIGSLFILFANSGLSNLINVSGASSLPAFFLFGLLAGSSTCAALVGGIILSMSKQWAEIYKEEQNFSQKSQPHILFNLGRIISYGFFGAILGLLGSQLKFSVYFSSILIVVVSVVMILLGLDLLGVKGIKFKLAMPKFIARYFADERHFQGKYMPFLMGAGTFFLPCGFTITVQSLALLSGSALQGGLILFLFALGTAPMLLIIGFSSAKFIQNQNYSVRFMKVAGVLVLLFALFNINAQLNVMGFKSLSDIKFGQTPVKNPVDNSGNNLPPIVDGKQIVKMDASTSGYNPSYLKVRAGIPIKWEITDTGTSGCTNAIISKDLFDGQIFLSEGEISTKEFTIPKPGKYKFSCWMGMVSGVFEAI